MTRFDIFDTVERLRREGHPFCVATVVRTADATSAKAGAKAAVTADGEILGHLGGACLQGAVRTMAGEALASGETRLLRVKPTGDDSPATADLVQFDSGCPSGGTADILIEPYRQPPRLVLIGTTPIATAIAAHANLAGYRVQSPEAAPDLQGMTQSDVIIIASQGQGDADALRTALQTPAGHIAMIASARKAASLVERMLAQGVAKESLARLKAPAGLDLGGVDPHEIAISVIAELISWRNARRQIADAPPRIAAAEPAPR